MQSLAYRFTFPPQQHHFDPDDNGGDPVEGGTGWTVTEIDNAAGTVVLRRGKGVARQAPPDGARPRRPVRHEGAPGGPSPPGRLDDRRGRPLPRPAEAASPRPSPGRRAGAADGHRGAARPRRRPRPDLPLRPGPAGVGQDLSRRPADHGAPSGREAGGGGVAEPQGDPQPARRGGAGGRRGAARLPGPEAGPGVRREVHPDGRAARVRRSRVHADRRHVVALHRARISTRPSTCS